MTTPPTILTTGSIVTNEGCAAIANSAGSLLFYTDGVTIYDQTNAVMANGTGLGGGPSSTQSAIIVKKPSSTNIYYVFTIGQVGGPLCYSLVDMSLSAGNGSVTVKNVTLNPNMSEKLISVNHCNGKDFWIVAHDRLTNFMVYSLTSAGVNTTPIVSNVGASHGTSLGFTGNMKISPTGKKLGLAVSGPSGFFELFDFDNSTGIVSNEINLGSFPAAYGCEFSPDGTKFYGDVEPFPYSLYQWDACAGSSVAIVASLYTLTVVSKIMGMQRAIDGKIYIAKSAANDLAVINSPNSASMACGYAHIGQSVFPKFSDVNLPNFTLLYQDQQPPVPPYTYTVSSSYGCNTASFNSVYNGSTTILGCAAVSASLLAVSWDFGDPLTGSGNTSNSMNPLHAFSASGTFTVQEVFHYSCGRSNDTLTQVLNVNQPCLTVNSTSITCSTPGSATCQAWGGIGPYTYTWVPTQQTGTLATGLGPGTYTIYFHDVGANATYTSAATFVSPVAFSGNIITNTSVVCYGASTGTSVVSNISGGSGSEYFLWTNGSVTYTTLNTPTIGILSAGIWTTQVTDALTGCKFSQIDLITQPTVNLVMSSNSPTACVNTNLILSGVQSGGSPFLIGQAYSYTWTSGPASASYTVNESLSGSYVYTLTSKDSLNCLLSNTIAVNFIPRPNLSVTSVSICPLQIGTLLAYGATSYIWNGPSVGPAVGSSFNDSPLTDTQYTVVGTAQSCTASATATISLKPLPMASMGISSPACEHDDVSMSVYGGISYAWTGPAGFSSISQAPQLTNVSLLQNGGYSVVVTAANNCTAMAQGTLLVNATPTIVITSPTIICNSQTLNLQANSVPGSSYFWTGPQTFSSALQNTAAANLPTGSSSYTVKVTSPQSCTNIAVSTVSVITPPTLNTILTSSVLCAQALNGSPNSVTLTTFGANTYTLTVPLALVSTAISESVSSISSHTSSGIATATLMGSNGVCTVSTTVNFNVIPNPTVGVSSSTPVICAGESFTYTSYGAQSYVWHPNSPAITTYSLGQVAVCHPSISSVFSVFGGSLGCFSSAQTVAINVNPIPLLTLGPVSPTVCLNEKINLTATGTGSSFLWQPSTGLNGITGTSVIASPPASQNYTVTTSAQGCTNVAIISLTVLPLPEPSIVKIKDRVCLNDEIILEGQGGATYEWQGPTISNYLENPLRITANSIFAAGFYTLFAKDAKGCQSSTATEVFVDPLPEGSLAGTLKACAPFFSDFHFEKFSNASDNIKASWDFEGKAISANDTFTYNFVTSGDYIFTGHFLDTVTSCMNTSTFVVNAFPKPKADFDYEPQEIIEEKDVSFFNSSTGEDLIKFNWYVNDNTGFTSFQKNTSHSFPNPGNYPVALIVSDVHGCTDSTMKILRVEEDYAFYMPNAFTPGDDDLNDLFLPVTRGIAAYEMQIFNRWGQLIFSTTELARGWDGTYNGSDCKPDSYVWKIKIKTNKGADKSYTGNVSLVR